jgi:hypothetical protein
VNIYFLTIVLDGMPYIAHHLPVFNALPPWINWSWHVVEGVARPVNDTRWCQEITPRLSTDGTTEYLKSITYHPRVNYHMSTSWNGKTRMCNFPLATIREPGLLWQVDSDEIWRTNQITRLARMMERSDRNCADFKCRYFVGQNIVVDRVPGTWTNDYRIMWRRVWKFEPGMEFASHEPPVIAGQARVPFTVDDTEKLGLVFDHYAYATEAQLRFKQQYYGYSGALDGWQRLQQNTVWPAPLRNFFPWVKDNTTAQPLYANI